MTMKMEFNSQPARCVCWPLSVGGVAQNIVCMRWALCVELLCAFILCAWMRFPLAASVRRLDGRTGWLSKSYCVLRNLTCSSCSAQWDRERKRKSLVVALKWRTMRKLSPVSKKQIDADKEKWFTAVPEKSISLISAFQGPLFARALRCGWNCLCKARNVRFVITNSKIE